MCLFVIWPSRANKKWRSSPRVRQRINSLQTQKIGPRVGTISLCEVFLFVNTSVYQHKHRTFALLCTSMKASFGGYPHFYLSADPALAVERVGQPDTNHSSYIFRQILCSTFIHRLINVSIRLTSTHFLHRYIVLSWHHNTSEVAKWLSNKAAK